MNKRKHLSMSVALIHLALLLLFSTSTKVSSTLKTKPIKVTTVKLAPIPKTTVVKTSGPKAKPNQKKATPKPKPKPKKKSVKPKQLVKNINKTLGSVKKTPAKSKSKAKQKSAPKVPSLSVKNSPNQKAASHFLTSYLTEVADVFRETLTLPEKGKVKITITVQPNGKIATINPVSSESDMNLDYLTKVLPVISLPPFQKPSDIEFTITFCDDL